LPSGAAFPNLDLSPVTYGKDAFEKDSGEEARSKYMKSLFLSRVAPAFALALFIPVLCGQSWAANLTVYDTLQPLKADADFGSRSAWKIVPSDLLALEADPLKASSDPGYYGREFSFKGDAVVETPFYFAAFVSAERNVKLYPKPNPALGMTDAKVSGTSISQIGFPGLKGGTPRYELVRNVGDEVILNAWLQGEQGAPVSFTFGKNEVLAIRGGEGNIRIDAPIEFGVVPGFVGDDLIFGQVEEAAGDLVPLPAQNVFLGLLKGEETTLVLTWPQSKSRLSLGLQPEQEGKRGIKFLDFQNDGQTLFVAPLSAPGIWHREKLNSSFLEKDVAIGWKRPFPAKWQTQLSESGINTTFKFREVKGTVWRGVPGSYNYPVWFEGEKAHFNFSKKVPPRGDAIVYFLEGQDTPLATSSPAEILKASLGQDSASRILDSAGRKLRTHHRNATGNVHRACTCGYTEAIQVFFEKRQEGEKKQAVEESIEDMIYFVRRHLERIDEYRRFAEETAGFLRAQGAQSPELKPVLENLKAIVEQIPQEYNVQLENMKSLDYARELAVKTIALTSKPDSQNLPAYMDLLKAWRGMGGAQDYVVAQCHVITRKLFQEAGYACISQPKFVQASEALRERCKVCLRNPDGYEIWPNF
jgi:hypothetical protein